MGDFLEDEMAGPNPELRVTVIRREGMGCPHRRNNMPQNLELVTTHNVPRYPVSL